MRFQRQLISTALTAGISDPPNGSCPVPVELKGSESPRESILGPNRSVSWMLPLPEANGSGETALLVLDVNGSGSFGPVVALNGSEELKGSPEGKATEDCLKKLSAANGSVPLKGSPPKGSE